MKNHTKRNIAVSLALLIGWVTCGLPSTMAMVGEEAAAMAAMDCIAPEAVEKSETAVQQEETIPPENTQNGEPVEDSGETEKEAMEEGGEETEKGLGNPESKNSESADAQVPEESGEPEENEEPEESREPEQNEEPEESGEPEQNEEPEENEEPGESAGAEPGGQTGNEGNPDRIDTDSNQEEPGDATDEEEPSAEDDELGKAEEAGTKQEIPDSEDMLQDSGEKDSLEKEGDFGNTVSEKRIGELQGAEGAGDMDASTANGNADESAVGLQMPKQLTVTIDPWEIDERGQVYSDQYLIQNTGDAPIQLVLKEVIYGLEQGIFICTDAEGLHEGEENSIYVQLNFGNGDQLVLTQERAEYAFTLEPGTELQFWFSGEVNENAAEPWEDGEVGIEMTYFWSTEEAASDGGSEKEEILPDETGGAKEETDLESAVGTDKEVPDAPDVEPDGAGESPAYEDAAEDIDDDGEKKTDVAGAEAEMDRKEAAGVQQ